MKIESMKYLIFISLLLGGCTSMPPIEGSNAKLFSGIEEPRDRENITISLEYVSNVTFACWKRGPAYWVLTLSVFQACAFLPTDKEFQSSGKEHPWCHVILPNSPSSGLVEHELRHCEGWDH